MKRKLRWFVVVALGVVVSGILVTSVWIGAAVRQASVEAVRRYGGDEVEALMRSVEDSTLPLRKRNRAVWALGQLGDPRALPLLESLHDGSECSHERALCQRELGKAIKLCRGATNLSGYVWRRRSEP